jgi:transcriptional regulator with XRE-family HTH domain
VAKTENESFANTLRTLMLDRRISASDLARAVWGTRKDHRGYDVAKGRDRIGHYLSGNSFPNQDTLAKLAKALHVNVGVLEKVQPTPAVREAAKPQDIQVVYFTDGPNSGSGSWSASKLMLSVKTITTILDLIAKDPVQKKQAKNDQ